MEKRIIFPVAMFLMAGASFAYGTWQYFYARQVQASADARLAHVVTTIEGSGVSRPQKEQLYATIENDLPPAPTLLGIDFSGSFASQQPDDRCTSEGQRAVCSALKREKTDPTIYVGVCGSCDPVL